jgi:hypothetical protein
MKNARYNDQDDTCKFIAVHFPECDLSLLVPGRLLDCVGNVYLTAHLFLSASLTA